jgi:hypothetical protein
MKTLRIFILITMLTALIFPGQSPATVGVSTARNDYSANGTTTAFAYTFRILDKTHLEVIDVDANGTETVKTVDTDYTVDGIGAAVGGNVNFLAPPASGHKIVILRRMPITQSSDYILNEGFPSERVEQDLDKQAMVDQMQNEQLARTLKLPKRSTVTNVTIPLPTECNLSTSRFLAWKTDGTNLECATAPIGLQGPPGPGAPGMSEAELQSGSVLACNDNGSTDTYVCNLTPTLTAYTVGMVIFLKANTANTGAATININSLGAKSITKTRGVALADNDIKAGQWAPLIYDGTNFEMFNGIANNASTPASSPRLASTTAFMSDDFISQTSVFTWNFTSTAGSGSYTQMNAAAGRPGIWRITTDAVANDKSGLLSNGSVTTTGHTSDTFDILIIAKLITNDANTTMRIGLFAAGGQTSDPPSDGIYIEKLSTDTQWFGTTRSASTQTRTTAIGTCDTNYHSFRIRRVNSNTIGFTIDNGTEQTSTTNIPSSTYGIVLQMKTHTTASKSLDIDYVDVLVSGLSR